MAKWSKYCIQPTFIRTNTLFKIRKNVTDSLYNMPLYGAVAHSYNKKVRKKRDHMLMPFLSWQAEGNPFVYTKPTWVRFWGPDTTRVLEYSRTLKLLCTSLLSLYFCYMYGDICNEGG